MPPRTPGLGALGFPDPGGKDKRVCLRGKTNAFVCQKDKRVCLPEKTNAFVNHTFVDLRLLKLILCKINWFVLDCRMRVRGGRARV